MRDNALWIQRISAACLLGSMGSATLAAREPGLVDRSPQRIIGGAPTDSYSHPAVVYLAAGGWFCTGSLIDELFVLTAAHCVVDGDGSVENPAGIVVERGYPEAYQRLDRGTVEEVLVHPEYAWHGAGFVNDVALLRLRVGFPSEIEPMEIASPQLEAEIFSTRPTRAAAVGWGRKENDAWSDDLREVWDTAWLPGECRDRFSIQNENEVAHDRTICFGRTDRQTTSGDSGGPRRFPGRRGGKPVLTQTNFWDLPFWGRMQGNPLFCPWRVAVIERRPVG